MSNNDNFKPFISADRKIPEFTFKAVLLGIILAIVFGAANAYLGLYAGMTVSASIPAAVISMAILRRLMKTGTILENNIVQTMASAGYTVASGIIFTIPALVIVGAWTDFHFWDITLIGISGTLLGVVFMIPLRKVLIVEEKELKYPEGLACAEVLMVGEKGGDQFKPILGGIVLGSVLKFLGAGMNMIKGTLEGVTSVAGKTFYAGCDVSMALIAVGYIINFDIALLMFIGGFVGWAIVIPMLGVPAGMESAPLMDVAMTLWKTQVRYIGVGGMLTGGVWSIIAMRHGIIKGVSHVTKTFKGVDQAAIKRTERDMGIVSIIAVLLIAIVIMGTLYTNLSQSLPLGLSATFIMIICSFVFVAVSSYMVGLIGSSNNPISGMIICALLLTAGILFLLGFRDASAIIPTLGIAGVVCVASAVGGDTSQDLKTGYLVGATPKFQQIGMIIGGVTSAFFIPPVLTLLHKAYGIGTGLKAPQANLFASITKAIFGGGSMPKDMIAYGVVGAILVIIVDRLILAKIKSEFRLYVMPIAVGIYLPVSLSVPILIGGVVRHLINRTRVVDESKDNGILYSSGLIAGEALMGIVVALLIFLKMDISVNWSSGVTTLLSLLALALGTFFLWKTARKS